MAAQTENATGLLAPREGEITVVDISDVAPVYIDYGQKHRRFVSLISNADMYIIFGEPGSLPLPDPAARSGAGQAWYVPANTYWHSVTLRGSSVVGIIAGAGQTGAVRSFVSSHGV